MPFTQTKLFKVFVAPLLFLICFFVILQGSARFTGFVLLLALVVSYIRFLWTAKTRWMRLIFVAFLIATFLPIDVRLTNYPGPPRFVPLIYGMPSPKDFAAEDRGEVVLGGCIMRNNPPRWVLIW